jgi:hypothetical protein
MGISEFAQFRPATQSKDFEKDFKEYAEFHKSFLELIQKAVEEDRVYRVARKDYAEALQALLDPESPMLHELKDGLIEISFIIKMK